MKDEWSLKIIRTSNGYYLEGSDRTSFSIEGSDEDNLQEHEALLWEIMNYFNFQGSKHDPERLRIIREKHE